MKKIWFFILFIIGIFLPINVYALEDNLVNIYLFHSDTCPHCKDEIKLLDKLILEYDNIRVYKYEISDKDNLDLMYNVADLYDEEITGVPFTIIGSKVFKGFSYENSKGNFIGAIEYYSQNGYKDLVGEYLGNIELPSYLVDDLNTDENNISVDEFINEYTNVLIDVPLIGSISTKNMALPLVTIIIGLVDGFNPCAMWILLFLISMLIGMHDKKKMAILGFTFIFTSGIVYLLFMVAWLSAAKFISGIFIVRLIIGIIAIVAALFNLYGYIKSRKTNGCTVVDDKKRNKIFSRIRKIIGEKKFYLAIIGIILLAISVNIIELACSAGLPVMWSSIMAINNISKIEEWIYLILYILCFLLDDLVVFLIAIFTSKLTGISTKYGKISKLVGGLLLLLVGILMIFKMEWLQLNFR